MDYVQPPVFGQLPLDEFGLPSTMFGVIDADFCAALSRVVMLGALLEDRLWTLLTQLLTPALEDMIFEGPDKNMVYQSDHAGRNAKQLIDDIGRALKMLAPQFQHHVAAGGRGC